MYKKALLLFLSILVACLVGELLVRSLGYEPYRVSDFEITVNPSPLAVPDPELGYMIYPGKFDIQFKNGYSWSATHGADSLRITGPPVSQSDTRPQLFVYGCSVAYGYGLSDSLTFPYLLQQSLPAVRVRNYAVPGFAQTQAYLQLKKSLAAGNIPKVVVLTYASFHDIRNTLCRERRKQVYPYNRKTGIDQIAYPVAEYTGPNSFSIHYERFRYTEWPLMKYLASVHLMETVFNESEVKAKRSHEVSKILIKAIYKMCQERNIELIVAGIQDDELTRDMATFCKEEGIETVDLSFDSHDLSYTLQPFDPHPNARGQAFFAERLVAFLSRKKLGETASMLPSNP
jgi:hypothetical protein